MYLKPQSYEVRFLRYGVRPIFFFLSFWAIFCPFTPYQPTNLKKLKKKKKKNCRRYHHLTQVYHKCQSHDVWLLRYEERKTEFFVILGYVLPFYPPNNNPENQNFEKIKRNAWMPGDVFILHMCTKNYDHMMYGSWDIKRDRQKFLSFWVIFCPFNPLTAWKLLFKKKRKRKRKTPGDIIILHKYLKSWSYAILFLRCGTWRM